MKFFYSLFIINLAISNFLHGQAIPGKFSVAIKLLSPPTTENVNLKVIVTNLSKKAEKINKYRRSEYKSEKLKAMSSYIIEIQKNETNKYVLITPSADIDP